MTCCHIRIERTTGRENNLPAMAKSQFIQGSEFDSEGEDSMPIPPVGSFKKVPPTSASVGWFLYLLATVGVSL